MTGVQGDPMKWNMPGWRIEQKYCNSTLIGNWCEERKKSWLAHCSTIGYPVQGLVNVNKQTSCQDLFLTRCLIGVFTRGSHSNTSTHLNDFRLYKDHKPDVTIRRSALMRSEGLHKENLFTHHGKAYSNNLISWYDEQFNHRVRDKTDKLPELRKWDGHKLAWAPERSDYPMKGKATNYGLYEKTKDRWVKELKAERMGHYTTDYSRAFTGHSTSAFPKRFASTPKHLSSHFNPINKLNKDLWLRRTPFNIGPEYPPTVIPSA